MMRQRLSTPQAAAAVVVVMLMMVGCVSGQIIIKFFDQSIDVEEGDQLTVRVQLVGTITENIRVIVEIRNDIGDDFIGDTQVATFTPSSKIAYVTFTVRDDDLPENKELFYLGFDLLNQQSLTLGTPSTMTVTIAASDDAFGIFSFVEDSPVIVREEVFTSVVSLRVQRTVSYFMTIGVTFQVNGTSEGADLGVDIAPVTGSVTFLPNQREATLQLQILKDTLPENDETFEVKLTAATYNARINVSEATVIIKANDAPMRFTQEKYAFDEGPGTKSWSVEVTRGITADGNTIGPINETVTCTYRFESGSAISGDDYSSSDGQIEFQPGETRKTIAFVVNDDTTPEIKETFKIRLLIPRGDVIFVNPNVAEVSINANDYPSGVITFKPVSEGSSEAPVTRVNEDTFTVAKFTVLRTEGTFGAVSVGWYVLRADQKADPVAQDVGPIEGRVAFADGENEKLINLTIVQDSLPEPAEQFDVLLQKDSLTGDAQVRGITTAKLIIEDSDNVYGTVEFGPDTNHGIDITTNPRTLKLSVTRNGGRLENALVNISVSYSDDGIEALPENIFQESTVTTTLQAGQDPTVVSIIILSSAFLTIGGRFVAVMEDVRLSAEPQYGAYNSPTLGTRQQVTIAVSETEANGESGFNNTASIEVDEPDSGTVDIPLLIIREGMSGTAAIRWSVLGVGSSVESVDDKDVTALAGTINIESGSFSIELVISIKADDVPEIDETMVVRLESIEPFATQRLRPGATEMFITVRENDNPGGVFQFAASMQSAYAISEGVDPIDVVVERTGGALVARSVQLTVEPDGAKDFFGAPNALLFRPGVRTRTVTLLAKDEGVPELAELFTMELVPLGNSTLGNRTVINITIQESDFPYGQIHFAATSTDISTPESANGAPINISLTIQRDEGTFNEVSVPWKLNALTEDVQPNNGTILFQPGQAVYNLTLYIVDDDISEGPETYVVYMLTPVGGAVVKTPSTATITIQENDIPIVFTETQVFVEEPGTHQLTVQRLGKLDSAVSVAYRTLDGSASHSQEPKDYQEISKQTLIFAKGETNKTVTVTVLDDALAEGNETFMVELLDASPDMLLTNESRAEVVILANDDAYGVFSIETPANNKVEEGSTIFYQIIRSKGIFGEVEVSWEIQNLQNATALPDGSEFQSTRGTVVFKDNEGQKPLAITPLADQQPEGEEMFRVALTSVKVLTGLTGRSLARLSDSNLQMNVVILSSDDPNGRFAFPTTSQELSVAEDFYPGEETRTSTTFTVERRQGTDGAVKVLWEIFAEPFGTNLPKVYDLLFIGQQPATMASVPSKQRNGTGTPVFSFSGAIDSHVTIPSAAEPTAEAIANGFTISAWVQPSPLCDGYIVARSMSDGTSHYYSLRLTSTATTTTLDMTITSETSVPNEISPAVSGVVVQDGRWHHVLVAVGNTSVQFYLDGSLIRSSAVQSSVPKSGDGVLLVGARPPGSDHYVGYMQDVRIWARTLNPSEAEMLYQTPPLKDITPVSGLLSYSVGVRTGLFSVRSLQDIEEEGDEVFSVSLVATTGGATLSIADSRTTLTVLKSDNANGLFGFREQCTPARVVNEAGSVVCNVARQRGDDGTVTVTWLVQQRTAQGLGSAAADFSNSTGSLVFLRGERLQTFQVPVTEENLPELDELFDITLVSVTSDDSLVGSTNTSGASIDPTKQKSEVTIVANDYPNGLLQFGKITGVPPTPGAGGMILPAAEIPTVRVGEEGGVVPLVVERAQGTLGAISVEWRTIDKTAVSEGKTPPDYVGSAGRLDFANDQNFGFVNVTVRDNSVPEGEKTFQVELVNPTGGAALGTASSVMVTVNASDSAYGVYQFADDSLTVMTQETGDQGYRSVFLKVLRLGGTIGPDTVNWTAAEEQDDGLDLTESSGTITFAAGQSETNLEIRVRGDTEPELDEVVTVTLTQAAKGDLGDALKWSATVTIEANDDPYGYFVITNLLRPIRVDEVAREISITVRRLYGTFGSVDVSYQTLAPNETYNYLPGPLERASYQDFTPVSGNVSFRARQESATFTVQVLDDDDPEQDESVFVRLTAAFLSQAAQIRTVSNSPRLGLASQSYAQIIISSNDDASGILQLSPQTLTVSEGGQVPQLRVVRSGGTFGEVTVQLRAINGDALELQDFSLLSRQVVLNSGETSKLVPLIIVDDLSPELSESFTIELLNQISGGASLGENRTAVITIEPSDDPNGVFGFASTERLVQEPENGQAYLVNITVVRTGGSIDVVTLQWNATLNGQALNSDISPTSGSIYFVSNEASRPITVSILPDDIPEGTESINITLLSATNGGRIGQQRTFILTITPNDSPHGYIQFASPQYTVQEGPAGAQYLQLSRSGGTYGRLRVYFSTKAVDVVAEATQDGSTVLSYFSDPAAGQRTEQGTSVDVSGETDQLLACSSACLATEACQSFQFGSTADAVACAWFSNRFNIALLNAAANFSVYNKATEKVQPVLSRIARPGEDYSSVTENSVLIQDGNITGQLPVTIVNDSIPELNEKFTVTLLRVTVDDPAAVTQDVPSIGALSMATVTIATNDNANGAFKIYSDSPTANLEQKTVSFEETDRLAVDLIVEREGGSIGEVEVTWQVNTDGRTATDGTDYRADGATLTFSPGQTRRIVTVTILDDTVPEEDEQFTISLTNPGGGATLGSDSHITVIILANDNVAGVLAFNTTSIQAAEGDQFSVGVLRTQSTRGTVEVNWVIEGLNGLQPQLGFQTFTGNLTFLPGESEKTIALTVLSDNTPEINEEYQLKLSGVTTEGVGTTGAAIVSAQLGVATITIQGSNDPHGIVQFASTSLTVMAAEDAGNVSLQVDRKFGAIGTVAVQYQVIQGTNSTLNADLTLATPGQDFRGVINSVVNIPSGGTSATISVEIINDLLPEIDEVFLVKLLSVSLVGSVDEASPPRLAASGTTAEVKIGANDGAQGVIVFAADSRTVSVDEVSPSIALKVQRTSGTFGQVSVMYFSRSVTENTGAGTDYTLAPGVLTFAPGESQKNIVIQIINDALPEPDEQFEVVLSNPQNGATLGQFARATVTILANDGSAGQVTFVTPARVEIAEPKGDNQTGIKAELSVQRGPGIYGKVSVPFVITNRFNVPTADVSPASGVVVFEDRQTTAVIEVTAVDDEDPETAEEFLVKLQAPDNGATLGNLTTATVIVQPSDSPYGLFEIYPAGTRVSSLDVEENAGTIKLDVVRTKGLRGRVSVDITTKSGTATFLSSSTNIVLAELQSVPAAKISAWHVIETGSATYVLMLTSLTTNEQLRSLLPASSSVEAGQSVLYRWQGELVYVRTLATDGATAADSFSAGGKSYFVIANSGKEGAREVQSILYRLDTDGSVEVVQGLTTNGAADVKYFVDNSTHHLAVANSLDDSSRSDIRSFVYTWDSATQKFGISPTQQVSTLYAKAVEVFTISGVVYMVVANFYDRTSGSYEIDSIVYRRGTDKSFIQHQRLATKGAVDVAHFTIGNTHFLAVASNRQDVISSPQTSRLYRWDISTQQFLTHQDLSTTRVSAVNAVTLQDGTVLLAIANSVGASDVLQWNVSQSRFVTAWSGDPYLLLQPITIQQSTGALHLLAAADVITSNDGKLFQIARITDQSDFVQRSVTLTFEPTQTELHTMVVVLQDDKPEDTESFTVDIVNPQDGAEVGPRGFVTINILSNDNAHGIIQFAPDSLNVVAVEKDGSDNTVVLHVVREKGYFGRVAVRWVATGDHNGLQDIAPLSGTVEFADGLSATTISLTIRDDIIAEFTEVTYVRLTEIVDDGSSLPSRGAQLGEATQAKITVLANDSPFGVVAWNTTDITTSEPEGTDRIVTLSVVREQGLQGELRVSYVTSMALQLPAQRQATSGEDFVATQGSVTLGANARQADVQIVVKQDDIPEASEMFYVNLTEVELVGTGGSNSAQPSVKIPGNIAQITILENDNARGTVQFDVKTNVEGRVDTYEEYGRNNTVTLTVRRSIGFFGSLTVNWQTTSINANNFDFFPSFGSVQFADGQQTADIIITIIDDQRPEEMESFDVKLIGVTGDAILGSVTSVRIAILKNDSPTGFFRFSTREDKIRESQTAGDIQGRAVLTVQRVQGTQGVVNVQWRLNADAQDDFVAPLEGTLRFEQADIEKTLTLQSRPDGVLEGRETFVVSLVSADNNADISPTEGDATVVILPDPGASGTISIVPTSRAVLIGEPGEYSPAYDGTAVVTLSRATGIFGEVVVTWAITPRDTQAFMQVEGSVTFLDQQQTANITLEARDDSDPELKTSFTLQLNSASGGAVISPATGAAQASIVFVASDYPHGLFGFTLPQTVTVSEDLTSVQATIRRTKGLVGQVQVSYTTTAGTATSGQDFYPAATVLRFENGVDSQTVQVSLIPDDLPEGPETFFINITSVQLLSPSGNDYTEVNGLQRDMPPALGPVSVKTVVIEKNDNAEGILEVENTAISVKEEAGTAQIAVIRRQGNYGQVSIAYRTQAITASSGVDYLPVNGTLQLDDGQGRALINVTLLDDSDREVAEQFSVTLSNPAGGVLIGNNRTAIITILKSDYPNGKFSFQGETERSIPNPDTQQSLVFYVQRTEGLLGQQEVYWRIMGPNSAIRPLSDTSDISYTASGVEGTSGRLTWGDGEAGSKQFTLNVKPWTSWEVAKTFVIEIYNIAATPATVGNGEASPTAGKVTLTVEKYGEPNGIIAFSGAATTARDFEEPSGSEVLQIGFPVVRQANTGVIGIIKIHWEVRGAGSDVTDVRPRNGTLLMINGQREEQITLKILSDEIPELTEEFTLVMTSVEGGAELNAQANRSVFRIRYNDNPHGLFGIRTEDQEVAVDPADLARSLALNFSRYNGTFGSVILTYSLAYSVPSSGVVLSSTTGTVTFGNGQQNAVASVAIRGNGFLQLGSTFSVSLVDVQFVGDGVTQPPQVKVGETEAQIGVPPLAANSEVSFLNTAVNVNDDDGTATLTIARSGTFGSISVDWAAGQLVTNLPSGVTNGQITPTQGSVSIAHGVESKNLTVQVNGKLGEAEIFMLRLPRTPETAVSGGARLAGQGLTATLDPSGVVRFMPASLQPRVSERDNQVTVTVCRVYGVLGRVEVTYSTEDDTAQGNFDYRSITRTALTMQPGQPTANISIPIFQDDRPEPSEQFFISLQEVNQLPTPTQRVITPRLASQGTSSVVTISESNDPYGVLWFETDTVTISERFTTVPLTIKRTGGLFGTVSVTVRTVGGGERWTSDIAVKSDGTTRDTIAEALGQRNSSGVATGGSDYSVLDTIVTFESDASQKTVNVVMLDDSIPEPQETVLVYLTQPTGGARVANGTYDGGVKGFAEITIQPSDLSNGLIGFAENSKTVQANEDLNPNVTLTLTRLNAYYGNVQVVWKAKLSPTSSEADDVQLTNQLKAVTGVGVCPPDQSLCTFQVQLIDDQTPEESFSFVVKLESVGDDARLNPDALFATVNVRASDFVRGLVQFVPNSRTIIMGANSRWVVVGVQRVQGLNYDVLVGYTTRMPLTTTDAGVTVYAALEGEDFTRQQGTLVFRAQSQAVQYINISLTPATASDNPFPKQFYIDLHDPSNGASISADYGRSVVRIVRGDEVALWTIVTEQQKKPFNDTNILITLGGLDRQAQDPLTNNEVTAIDNMVKRINEEGTKRPLPEQVVDATLGLLCKMLDPSKVDATRGQHSLAERVEELTYNMLYGRGCPSPVADGLLTKSCAYVKVSAGRWTPVNLQGFEYEAQHKDVFKVPTELTISTGADGINDQCADFHIIEYNSRQWFPTQNEEQLLNNRVISFGMKGKASAPTSDPVKFRIHTPDSRVATKRAQCVYFDTSVEQWVSPKDVCYVENNLNLGMDNFVSCSCSHMTSYAVVAEVYDAGIIGYTIWFYVACFICMSCMALVIISHHLCHQRPTVASSLMQHMLFAIFAAQLCLVVDAYLSPTDILTPSAREDNYRCIVMGLFLHYFFLAQFMWIVVQSINFWQILIMNDEHTERRYVIFFVLGWGLPLVFVALFYAVAFNVYKYETDLPVDYIYGDVYNNGEICFLTSAYASVGGIIVPVLLLLLMSGIVFIKAFQLSPQWQAYDDIYRGRYNSTEVQLLLFLWAVLALTCLWAGLHMVYSQLWMLVLFCISDILLGLFAFVLYAVIRNPCLNRCSRTQKEYYTASNTDIGTLPPPSLVYNNRLAISNNTINSLKGSRTSLINEAWERGTIGSKSQMTVRRATPSQVYLNPPIAIVSPSASSDLDPQDFDDLLFALKTGHSFTPSEMSRSIADDDSQLSTKLDRYETKRIDIADTHL